MLKSKIFALILRKYSGLIFNIKKILNLLKAFFFSKKIFLILQKICSFFRGLFKQSIKNLFKKINYIFSKFEKPLDYFIYKKNNNPNWKRFLSRSNQGFYLERFLHQHSFINLYKEHLQPIFQKDPVKQNNINYQNFYQNIAQQLNLIQHDLQQYTLNQNAIFFCQQEFSLLNIIMKIIGIMVALLFVIFKETNIFSATIKDSEIIIPFQFSPNSMNTGI